VSASFEPSGRFVAVGTTVGRFIVLDSVTGGHVVSVQVGTESLDVLSFSPGQLASCLYKLRSSLNSSHAIHNAEANNLSLGLYGILR